MKKINTYTLAVFLGLFSCVVAATTPLTLEQFGGHAYYKRFDGKLTYNLKKQNHIQEDCSFSIPPQKK